MTKAARFFISMFAAIACVGSTASGAPVDATFTYQGRLTSSGEPLNGTADLTFTLWNAATFGTLIGNPIVATGEVVTDGLVTVDLDWGLETFDGDELWLEVGVRSPAGSGSYSYLPRQQIRATPYAAYAVQTRGIHVEPDLDVVVGRYAPGSALRVHDGFSNTPVSLWSSSITGAGLIDVGIQGSASTVRILGDDNSYAGFNGLIELYSFNGGPGGMLSLYSDEVSETVQLRGGTPGSSGSIMMFDSGTHNPFLSMVKDSSNFGGGHFAVARNDQGDVGFEVNGNWSGLQSTRIAIYGSQGSNMVFDSSTTGNPTVILPTGAIDSTEMLNEPGVSANKWSPERLFSGVNVLTSSTIDCPTSGYCVVFATYEASIEHNYPVSSITAFGISSSTTGFHFNEYQRLRISSGWPSSPIPLLFPLQSHGMFPVSAGSHTFYLLAQPLSDLYNNIWDIHNMQISVMFFPTSYGYVGLSPLATQDISRGDSPQLTDGLALANEPNQSKAANQARRDAEAADHSLLMELEARIRELEAKQGLSTTEPQHAKPHLKSRFETGSVIDHEGDASP